ncbi:hypothetical protein G6F22_006759 [Rhizopus arrhizus]|nr:hypothetical protein G6F22_006759 [Rhizopus arrhizus]
MLRPGRYAVPAEMKEAFDFPESGVDAQGRFTLQQAHLTLLRAAVWREVDAKSLQAVLREGERFWPMPYIDGKRPYGDASYYQIDMARLLGEPYPVETAALRNAGGAASLPGPLHCGQSEAIALWLGAVDEAADVVCDRHHRQQRQQQRQRPGRPEAEVEERIGAGHAAHEEQRHHQAQHDQLRAVCPHGRHGLGIALGHVPVKQLAQFDADVGHHARHVRRADLGARHLGDHRVLQAHDVAQQHDRARHVEPAQGLQVGAQQPEAQQQHGFEQQRQGVFAGQVGAPAEIDQERGTGRAGQEGEQCGQALQHHDHAAQRHVVGHHRNDARHVRGVLLNGQETAGIDRPGGEGQEDR